MQTEKEGGKVIALKLLLCGFLGVTGWPLRDIGCWAHSVGPFGPPQQQFFIGSYQPGMEPPNREAVYLTVPEAECAVGKVRSFHYLLSCLLSREGLLDKIQQGLS